MGRYRNARYAPESLERKLSPSSTGISPAPALVDAMSAPTADMIVSPPLYAGYGSFTDGSSTSVDYIPTVALADDYAPSPTLYGGDTLTDGSATSADYIPTVALADDYAPSPTLSGGDTLLADGDGDNPTLPLPGDGLPPLGPPPFPPAGPVVPA